MSMLLFYVAKSRNKTAQEIHESSMREGPKISAEGKFLMAALEKMDGPRQAKVKLTKSFLQEAIWS